MKNICIIGSGQLGSRHLQALKTVGQHLNITVVDPSEDCLKVAKERCEAIPAGTYSHNVTYVKKIPQDISEFELAIVATNSNVRRNVVEELLKSAKVRYLILEKLLFQNREDYDFIHNELAKTGTKAWVNCSMRTMPFYHEMRDKLSDKKISYHVSGSQFGLITNAIHYIDHMVYLTGATEFTVDTTMLDPNPIDSKRKGFLELNGTLKVNFQNGSIGIFTCYPDGDAPVLVEIMGAKTRFIVRETERKSWISQASSGWIWDEIEAKIPYQSEMTAAVTESILTSGKCSLVRYEESMQTHLILLEALQSFLNITLKRDQDFYPFT